jgi:hypothetical protein
MKITLNKTQGGYTGMKILFDATLPTRLGNQLKSEYAAGESCQVPISGLVTTDDNEYIQFIVPFFEGGCEFIYFTKTSFAQEGFFNESLNWKEVSFQGCFITTLGEYLEGVGAEVLNTRVSTILEVEDSYVLQTFLIPAFCRGVLYSLLPDIRAERETVVESVLAHSRGFVYLKNKEIYRLKGWNYYVPVPESRIERSEFFTVVQNPSEWAGRGSLSFEGCKYGVLNVNGTMKCAEFDFPWEFRKVIDEIINPPQPRRGGGDRKTTAQAEDSTIINLDC